MTPRTILVVEDNPITRKMLCIALESEDYHVLDARDGRTALELARNRPPDLVLQDYVLPDMDGLQLMERLRALPGQGRDVPFLVVTGMVSQLEELRARAAPATTFLPKPIEPSRLVEVVRTLLDGETGPAGQGRRVLVVDDEVLNLKLTALRLRDVGFDVETASGAAPALEKAGLSPPDAILSDVLMPEMDGFALCAALRRHPRLAQVPVVLHSSAYVDDADRRLARGMGASALVVRTPDMQEAILALGEAFRAGPPPFPATDTKELAEDHRSRVQLQLEQQVARNEALLRQGAIQAAALSVVRALAEGLANPRELPSALGDVLVHCLDAAGLSTGLLYLVGPDGGLHTQAQAGLRTRMLEEAPGCFGHPDVLSRALDSEGDVLACTLGAPGCPEPALYEIATRLESRSVLVIPLRVLGQRCGVLLLASSSQDLSERTWLSFARTLAVQFGQTIALGQSVYRGHTSEARYRTLQHVVSSSPAVLFSLRPTGQAFQTSWTSENVEGLLGYTPEEALAPDWWVSHLHLDDRERVVGEVTRLLSDGYLVQEYRFELKQGGYRWLRAELRLLRDAAGDPVEAVGSWSDVTERKQAELRLEESEEQYRLLFQKNPHPMYVFDAESLAFLAVNDAAVRQYGYSREEFLALTLEDIRSPEEVPKLLESLGRHPATQAGFSANRIVFRGREAWLVLGHDVTDKAGLEAHPQPQRRARRGRAEAPPAAAKTSRSRPASPRPRAGER